MKPISVRDTLLAMAFVGLILLCATLSEYSWEKTQENFKLKMKIRELESNR